MLTCRSNLTIRLVNYGVKVYCSIQFKDKISNLCIFLKNFFVYLLYLDAGVMFIAAVTNRIKSSPYVA
jgi:hypothetical protein